MGLFDRFKKQKRFVTSQELAKFLAHSAVQFGFSGGQSLNHSIQETGEGNVDVNPIELLIVAALPLDILIVGQFKSRSGAVRQDFKSELIATAKLMVREEYVDSVDWSGWPAEIEARFLEYGQLMHSTPGPTGLRKYATAAAERVTGMADPLVAGLVASQFSLTLKHMGEALQQYEIA